jgi:hypothetical protein
MSSLLWTEGGFIVLVMIPIVIAIVDLSRLMNEITFVLSSRNQVRSDTDISDCIMYSRSGRPNSEIQKNVRSIGHKGKIGPWMSIRKTPLSFLKFFEYSNPVLRICQTNGNPFSTDRDCRKAAEFIIVPRFDWNSSSDKGEHLSKRGLC